MIRTRIAYRVAIPVLIAFVLAALPIWITALPTISTTLENERVVNLRFLTDVPFSILHHYHQKVLTGELSKEEALALAKRDTRKLRYDGLGKTGNYFFFLTIDPEICTERKCEKVQVFMHPIRPKNETTGKNMAPIKDANGKLFFQEFAKKALRDHRLGTKDAVIQYTSFKRGVTKSSESQEDYKNEKVRVEKIAFVRYFAPWNILTGTGVFVPEVNADVAAVSNDLIQQYIVILAILVVISGFIIWQGGRSETGRQEAEARYSEILDIAPEAVIAIGSNMKIQMFNQGAERIFGYRAEEMLGQPLERLMPKYLRDDHQRHVQEFDHKGETYRLMDKRQEIIGLKKDGTEFPAMASVSKTQIRGQKIFTVMMRDITEKKHAHEAMLAAKVEAETANRAKSEFLAAMSHDLRTPLNAILGFAEIMTQQYLGPINEKYRGYAKDIKSSGQHLLMLVNEILDLSTIEAGKQFLAKEKLSTPEIVDECRKIVEDKARSNGISLMTEVSGDLPPLYADKRASKQILLNLLSNAVKYTPEGGNITVSAEATDQNTSLKVIDTGKGIPAEELPKLTELFARADNDPYLAEQSWGMGLTITQSLVDLHEGTLDIDSRVGKGTTVTVTLPNAA